MNVEVPHSLGKETAILRLQDFLDRIKTRYQDQVSNFTSEWVANVLNFSFATYGFTIAGKLIVDDNKATVEGDLPFAAMFFQGRIEQSIGDELKKALNEPTATA